MKHKMRDLAMPMMEMSTVVGEEHRKYYPSINLNENQMPDLDDYDVSEPITISFEGFIVGKNVIKRNDIEHTDFNIELRRGEVTRRE